MMKKKMFFPLMFCLMLTAGCVFHHFRSPKVFELQAAVPEGIGEKACQVVDFCNNSGAGLRMLLTQADGRVEFVRGCRWASDPGLLVSCALNRVLLADGKTALAYVSGTLNSFSAEPEAKRFVLSGTFLHSGREYSFRIVTPLEGKSADALVRAANLAVSELAKRIAGTL